MKFKKIDTQHAKDERTGIVHIFETYEKDEGAPYYVSLNGSFMVTAESRREAEEEIQDTIRVCGWRKETNA